MIKCGLFAHGSGLDEGNVHQSWFSLSGGTGRHRKKYDHYYAEYANGELPMLPMKYAETDVPLGIRDIELNRFAVVKGGRSVR